MKFKKKRFHIGLIGVGKLGQSCGEMMAEKHQVVGFDLKKRFPENFLMAENLKKCIQSKDFIFVAVETNHHPLYDGRAPTSHLQPRDFDYSAVKSVLRQINNLSITRQNIVLISTVLPGTVRRELAPLVSRHNLIYNPYLIAMGTVKWDMVNPEMIIIGGGANCKKTVQKLKAFYETFMENNPRYCFGTWEEAECIKVFYNTFISAKISLVNMIQDVAEKMGHMNAEMVCDALAKSDRRIMGPAYMKPGMGDGGACHPRDNIALRWLAKKLNLGYDLFSAVMRSREVQAKNMANQLSRFKLPVVIVGKAYKPLVEYENGSSSMLVGHFVKKNKIPVYYHDEIVGEYPPKKLKRAVYLLAHCAEVTYGHQLTAVKQFFQRHKKQSRGTKTFEHSSVILNTANKRDLMIPAGSVIVDPWRKVPKLKKIKVIHYGNPLFCA
jgi:UDPglucose 6-dehydrogenase